MYCFTLEDIKNMVGVFIPNDEWELYHCWKRATHVTHKKSWYSGAFAYDGRGFSSHQHRVSYGPSFVFSESYGDCGTLSGIGPQKLIGNGTIRRCYFVGAGMVLLEELCHCGVGLWHITYAQTMPSATVNFLLPSDQDVTSTISS